MKKDKYILVNRQDEIINRCEVRGLEEAINYFSIVKNLPPEVLTNIYSVYEYGTRKPKEKPQRGT